MRTLEVKTRISHSPGAVWAVLADFANVAKWAPGIYRSRLKGKRSTGKGARRVLRHAWGFGIEERVTRWNEGAGYAFELLKAPYPMIEVLETWQLEQSGGCSDVTTTVSYNMRLGVLGHILDMAMVRFLVAREMRTGMRGLERYLDRHSAAHTAPVPGVAGAAAAKADRQLDSVN